ncbi:MAG: DUF1549 domain-containing protein [Planctomycetota bacterium]
MQRTPLLIRLLLPAILLITHLSGSAFAQDTPRAPGWLAAQIDTLLDQSLQPALPGPVSSDTEWLRRVFLDLAGRIPTALETRQFVADAGSDKRAQQIERLLGDPAFSLRMAGAFHILLMERRGEHAEWLGYLQRSFAANKPWDVMVREILDPDANDESVRGAAFFQTRRLEKVGQQETDYAGLTRDIGRLFLGCDLQCAQCHDHLSIDSYRQVDFQGLYTVYQNAAIRTDVSYPAIAEKLLTKKTEFMSVFEKQPRSVGPRIPFGMEQQIPQFEKDQEYTVAPDRKTNFPGVPKFRGMQVIAADLTAPGNRRFAENAANRMWFLYFGTGLVNPLDQLHDGNPPTHPQLLSLLADALVTARFDLREFTRELLLTRVWQRTTAGSAAEQQPYQFGREKRLSAGQLLASMLTACGPAVLPGSTLPPATAVNPESAEQKAVREAFVKAFGNVPQDPELEFAPSLKAALFVMNDPLVLRLLQPAGGNLAERLTNIESPQSLAEELWLSVLSRFPDDAEKEFVRGYLRQQTDKPAAVSNLIWSLLASTEFCLNH